MPLLAIMNVDRLTESAHLKSWSSVMRRGKSRTRRDAPEGPVVNRRPLALLWWHRKQIAVDEEAGGLAIWLSELGGRDEASEERHLGGRQ